MSCRNSMESGRRRGRVAGRRPRRRCVSPSCCATAGTAVRRPTRNVSDAWLFVMAPARYSFSSSGIQEPRSSGTTRTASTLQHSPSSRKTSASRKVTVAVPRASSERLDAEAREVFRKTWRIHGTFEGFEHTSRVKAGNPRTLLRAHPQTLSRAHARPPPRGDVHFLPGIEPLNRRPSATPVAEGFF